MPRIFDNIENNFLPTLRETLKISDRGDFCVGYFRLRGWKLIDDLVQGWKGGDKNCCRLLIGMQAVPHEDLRALMGNKDSHPEVDQQTVFKLKKSVAQEFRNQLALEAPTNEDEVGLRRLSSQIRESKLRLKVFLRHPLHAKLYLAHREDPNNPTIGFVGSSNLTFAGLSKQGELNVDVLDHDACEKLKRWFEDRWEDSWCLDISNELADLIDNSWAREQQILPYHIYLKMAYHLSREARNGLDEFQIPRDFGIELFDFQSAAVKLSAHHLNKRKGVLIGDVVGLGKTLMASAVARIFQDDHGTEALIICPKNLIPMWKDHVVKHRLLAEVISINKVSTLLPDLRRYRLVLIDESHNLRNREGKRFKAIQEYIRNNDSRCILLSATPYNKSYLDLSAQLRLFLSEEKDIGIRPEAKIKEIGETNFVRQYQCSVRSLAAFEKSDCPDDWRDLMRLFMVRRTRTFIKNNYAHKDSQGKKFLLFDDGRKSYFPERIPKTLKFETKSSKTRNQYESLFSDLSVASLASLNLPRYGLGNYVANSPKNSINQSEEKILVSLSRAGKRLMGVCRTNLFKRLESGGPAFIRSLERHILRNYVFIYAIQNSLELPIGPQSADLFDSGVSDDDVEELFSIESEDEKYEGLPTSGVIDFSSHESLMEESERIYKLYQSKYGNYFKWIRADLFVQELTSDLRSDAENIANILKDCGSWEPENDKKLEVLYKVIQEKHPNKKIIIFTQFADTVKYLTSQLKLRGVTQLEGVTGQSENPSEAAWRFSPVSNGKAQYAKEVDQFRVLITTDVLSEGFNLQDASIIVNFDLPWAIIRLVQRAGRVDRIGQQADKILCYSFLPAEGIERILGLRARVRDRLRQNAEVVGTDEAFFEGEKSDQPILDMYHEKAGLLDDDGDGEVDLASYAYQIWKNAVDADPSLNKLVPELPPVAYSSRDHIPNEESPEGVLVYIETSDGIDSLAWINKQGKSVTQSQLRILETARCSPETPFIARDPLHHDLVASGLEYISKTVNSSGGQLGRPTGARFKTYERLKHFRHTIGGSRDLIVTNDFVEKLERSIEDIYKYPLKQTAIDVLNRQLKIGISDESLARLIIALKDDDRLSISNEIRDHDDPKIICSLGIFRNRKEV